ncbi:MAG: hypothetical protein DI585_01315 [Pseudomonas fluorescens]|nr:MAG: hypothetical protein DI585_01315 [Pseudomonas fluorescens]
MQFIPLTFTEIVAQASQSPLITPQDISIFNSAVKALEKNRTIKDYALLMEGITESWTQYTEGHLTSIQLTERYRALMESAVDLVEGRFQTDYLWFLCTWKWAAGWHPWLQLLTYPNTGNAYHPDIFQQWVWKQQEPRDMFTDFLQRIQINTGLEPEKEHIYKYTRYTFSNRPRHLSVNFDDDGMGFILHSVEYNGAKDNGFTLKIEAEPDGTFHLGLNISHPEKVVPHLGLPYLLAASRRHDEAHSAILQTEVNYSLICGWDHPET